MSERKLLKVEVYGANYTDLIMGTAIAGTYLTCNGQVMITAKYLESSTINYAELVAINRGLARITENADYVVHTNSRYVSLVLKNCQSWRKQGILEEKAHIEQVKLLLGHIDRLGSGEIDLMYRGRDEIMTRNIKHCKHFYHEAQLKMVSELTTDFDLEWHTDLSPIKDLPGSVLWKSPLSMTIFQKKMESSRRGNKPVLKLITGGTE